MERATAGAGRCVGGWIEVDDAIGIAEKIDIQVPDAIPLRPDVVGGAQYVADPQGREFRFWDVVSKSALPPTANMTHRPMSDDGRNAGISASV